MDKDLYQMAKILGEENPQVRALLWAANDPAMTENVKVMMKSLLKEKGWDPQNLPKFILPRKISKSDYIIGKAASGNVTGDDIGPSHDELDSHIGIYGQTGGGKSTLLMELLLSFTERDKKNRFIVWDAGGEYRRLLPFYKPTELIWMQPDDLGVNPLQVFLNSKGEPVTPPAKHIDNIRELLRMLWLNEPSLNLFSELLDKEYAKRGVYDDPVNAVYPSFSDILIIIENLNTKNGSDRHRAKGKLLDRIGEICRSLPGLDVQCSRNTYELFGNHSIILDVSELRDITRPFLFSFMCMMLRSVFYMEEPVINGMLGVEESHEVMGGQINKRTSDLKEGISSGILRDIRKSGFCAAVVTQLCPDLDKSVRGNLGSVISFHQGDSYCVREAAADLNLKPWQSDELGKLTGQQAVARFSRYGEPINIFIKDAGRLFQVPKPSREQARQRSQPILDKIPFIRKKYQSAQQPGTNKQSLDPSSNEYKAFVFVVHFPHKISRDRQAETSLTKDADSRALNKLKNLGLVRFADKVGAKFQLFEPTDRGLALAQKLGLPVATPHKGGNAHRCLVHYLSRSLHDFCPDFSFTEAGASVAVGNVQVQPDLVILHPSGRRWCCQCCVNNNLGYEVDRLLRLTQLTWLDSSHPDHFERVICLSVNKTRRRNIEQAIRQQTGGSLPGGLVMMDFDELMSGVNWKDVIAI